MKWFAILLFYPCLVFGQHERYIGVAFQYTPIKSEVYLPATGAVISYGRVSSYSLELLCRTDVPRQYEWPDVGKFNMITSKIGLMGSAYAGIVNHAKFKLSLQIGAGVSFYSVRRILTHKKMREYIMPYTYKKTTIAGFLGIDMTYILSNKIGVNLAVGGGTYFVKLGIIRLL